MKKVTTLALTVLLFAGCGNAEPELEATEGNTTAELQAEIDRLEGELETRVETEAIAEMTLSEYDTTLTEHNNTAANILNGVAETVTRWNANPNVSSLEHSYLDLKRDFRDNAEALETATEGQVPTERQSVHDKVTQANTYYAEALELFYEGMTEMDAVKINEAGKLMERGGDEITAATNELLE